jgi:glycosyltransferase involved in cell wall biosynthesis
VTGTRTMVLVSFLEPWSMGAGMGAPSLHETLVGYVAAGWHIHYVTAAKRALGAGGSHGADVDVAIPGVTVHRFGLPTPLLGLGTRVQAKADRLYLFPTHAARAVAPLLDRLRPDLLYAYEEGAVLAVHRLRREGRVRVPVLHRFQGTILGEAYAHWPTVLRKTESWLALTMPADLYVMTDDGTRGDRALRHWNRDVRDDNLLFVRNGIDRSIGDLVVDREAVWRSHGLDPSRRLLLMVSRLAHWKRLDRGIDLLAALQHRLPDVDLVIAGDGEARGELEARARQAGIAARVHFLGAQPRAEVARLMRSCDVFLSLYDISNCGNPLFEALLAGRAVVTLDNGGTADVITDGDNGRLLQPDDRAGLEAAVTSLCVDDHERARLGEGAVRWARTHLQTWQERMTTEVRFVEAFLRRRGG